MIDEEKLDSPLIVHKVTDASYQETANEVDVDITHIEDGGATLERHRFRRVKKKKKWPYVLLIVVIIVAVLCGLYYSGVFNKTDVADDTTTTERNYLTTEANKFEGIITVKESYIFFEGTEIDGTEQLAREVKYISSGTKFIVQDENADDKFLSEEVLPILSEYGIEYDLKFIISSGLISKYESVSEASSAPLTSSAESNASPSAQ